MTRKLLPLPLSSFYNKQKDVSRCGGQKTVAKQANKQEDDRKILVLLLREERVQRPFSL